MRTRLIPLLAITLTLFGAAQSVLAQANIPIYTDRIVNGFQDWGWATRNFANTSPVHNSSADSISVGGANGGGIAFHQTDFDTSPYASFSFWAHGGTTGGQLLQVFATLSSAGQPAYTAIPALTANTWTLITIPLSSLNAANKPNLAQLTIQVRGGSGATFYLDDIQLNAAAAPATVHLNVNTANSNRLADGRWFGVNTATWDGNLSQTTTTINLLKEGGLMCLRWPGGSTSDTYHYASDPTGNTRFMTIATNVGAQVFITVNYGSSGSNEAASWVQFANIVNHCGFKYWEIGNECYGTWETDTNAAAHDPWTYANRAAGYIAMMKAVDPTIKVGVVGAPGEDSYVNNTSHPATNPRTGVVHNGWTPVMLTTLKSLGVTPDFFVHHVYPEYTNPSSPPPVADSDPLLMQASANWAKDAADLRQQLSDYMGGATGSNVELVCTENNSDSSSAMGKQLTSLVNGLYIVDSACRLMKTEFNGYLWWDLRNGHNSTGTFDPTIYGWRTYGDEGMIDGVSGKYPMFYSEKLLQFFVRPGDTVLNGTSDYLLLANYAAKRTNGTLTVLVMNKDTTTNFNGQVALTGYLPDNTATVRSYGIPQDNAVRDGITTPPGVQDIYTNTLTTASTNFTYSFPALSMTLFTFTPGVAPGITTQPLSQTVLGGSNVTFSVTVTGTAPLGFQWRLNGVAIPGATTNPLVVPNVGHGNEGDYSVVVSNIVSTILSSNATLVVHLPPTVNIPLTSRSAELSSTVILDASVTGDPTLSYQWYFASNPSPIATTPILTLNPVGFGQSGTYRVVVTNSFGSVTNGPMTLTVVDTTPPHITTCAGNLTLSADANCQAVLPDLTGQVVASDASGTVTVTQNPLPGTILPLGQTGVTLTAHDSSGNTSFCGATATVADTTPPLILSCVTNVTLVLTNCQYLLPDLTSTNYIVASDNCSSVTVTQMPPSGVTLLPGSTNDVVLTAFDSAGNATSNTVAVFVPATPVITTQPTNISVIVSSNALFSVEACGPGALAYQWRHADADLTDATNATLLLNNISTNDAGGYTVVVTNDSGSVTSVVATLTALPRIFITSQPQSIAAVLGATAAFSVTVSGQDPFAYQWRTNGADLTDQTNSTFTIPSVQPSDYGNYTVLISNEDGSVLSDTATLTPATSPTLQALAHGPSTFTLRVPTQLGPNYTIEYSFSLNPPSWQVLTNFAGTGSPIVITDVSATNVTEFYRVHVH